VLASPPLLPPSSVPPLEEPLPPDDDDPPLLEDPLELPDPAPHWHSSGWPLESHWVVPVSDPWHEHVSICPGWHWTPAELVLHPADAKSSTEATARTATKTALMFCMVTPCNPRVTAHCCHGRCR
jgi:hypothetical protein